MFVILYTRTNNPKDIEGPLKEMKGFGWKFIEKNKELLFGKQKEKKQKKINEV